MLRAYILRAMYILRMYNPLRVIPATLKQRSSLCPGL